MAPSVKKIPDKLTDAEKKKVKQANKAKADPKRAAEKKIVNTARRVARGQETVAADPIATVAAHEEDTEVDIKNEIKGKKEKPTSEEKELKKQAKIAAIMKEFANAKGVVRP
jgi:hypothetical protein